jgi:hypothetical protein
MLQKARFAVSNAKAVSSLPVNLTPATVNWFTNNVYNTIRSACGPATLAAPEVARSSLFAFERRKN